MNFKRLALVAIVALALPGCTDAERAKLGSIGSQATITCYSGGVVVFEDTSTGVVQALEADGFAYRSAKTGEFTRVFADCVIRGN